ncbi:hypothetical protein FG05_02196 [Fusarium graminearum]|nr:hypothetical protein FG05_02196 [Fusarium graminearum]
MRNCDSPSAAILSLLTAIFSWDKQRPWGIRLTFSLALLSLAALLFPLAAVIVPPQVVTKITDDIVVLSKEQSCGFRTEVASGGNLVGRMSSFFARDLEETTTARTYARDWYNDGQGNDAIFKVRLQKGLAVESLPYTENTSAECPFADEFCKTGSNGAISFDTGLLDSHVHLGINAPNDERVQYRWRSTCTPIQMNGHQPSLFKLISNATGNVTDMWTVGTLAEIHFGPHGGNSYTLRTRRMIDSTNINAHFEIQTTPATPSNLSRYYSRWDPIDAFSLPYADLSLVQIGKATAAFSAPVSDPIFQANGTNYPPISSGLGDSSKMWAPDTEFAFIICADEHQFCNPRSGKCTEMDGVPTNLSTIMEPFLGNNDQAEMAQQATAMRLGFYAQTHFLEHSVKSIGNKALILEGLLRPGMPLLEPIPDNHWCSEVRLWFETGLAKFQFQVREFTNVKITPRDKAAYDFKSASILPSVYLNDSQLDTKKIGQALDAQCQRQRVRSSGQLQNFSVFGTFFIVGASVLLWPVSLLAAPL